MIREGSRTGRVRAVRPNSYSFLDSRWYAYADLLCVAIAAGLWYVSRGQLGWWPLLIAVLPWPARIIKGRLPLARTAFDWLLLLFLITALLGVFTAYNRPLAVDKFWLIVGAILLFYAVAGQPTANIWSVWGGLGVAGVLVAAYFLTSHDWVDQPAKLSVIQELGLQIMAARPPLPFAVHQLHPNVAGGLMAMLAPALIAFDIYLIRRARGISAAVVALIGLILAAGLVLTTSRGAWLALFGGMLFWIGWALSALLSRQLYVSRRQAFLIPLAFILIIAVTWILVFPGGIAGLSSLLPGPSSVGRLELSQDTINLIRDYSFTGSGLGSFPGLYSQYARITPVYYLPHAHNLFLDVGLEQGIVGLIALAALLVITFLLLTDSTNTKERLPEILEPDLLRGSLLASLAVIVLHGLVEDPLYGSRGLLLLFVIAGLTAALVNFQPLRISRLRFFPHVAGLLVLVVLLGVAVYAFGRQTRAAFLSNLAAVQMAQVELDESWPTNVWQGDALVDELAGAQAQFEEALAINPHDSTSLYRLGLIALARRDFASASEYLTRARLLNPGHRGIRKALGYSLAWEGELNAAAALLEQIPEAQDELNNYGPWWSQQGLPELSERATELRSILTN